MFHRGDPSAFAVLWGGGRLVSVPDEQRLAYTTAGDAGAAA